MKLDGDELEVDVITYDDNQQEWQVRVVGGTEEIAEQIKQHILENQEKAEKYDAWTKSIAKGKSLSEENKRLKKIVDEINQVIQSKIIWVDGFRCGTYFISVSELEEILCTSTVPQESKPE